MKDQRSVGVFSEDEKSQIAQAVTKKYQEVASSSAQGKFKYDTGKKGAEALGYDAEVLSQLPDDLLDFFCGVGNPFIIWKIRPGEDILDVGSGGGLDLIVARGKTGEQAKVCGVDLTPEMIAKAEQSFKRMGIDNIELHHIDSERLPFPDNSFDAVLSNGVINLSPAKAELFAEIFRVLRPGGRLQFADIVVDGDLPPQVSTTLEAWSQ